MATVDELTKQLVRLSAHSACASIYNKNNDNSRWKKLREEYRKRCYDIVMGDRLYESSNEISNKINALGNYIYYLIRYHDYLQADNAYTAPRWVASDDIAMMNRQNRYYESKFYRTVNYMIYEENYTKSRSLHPLSYHLRVYATSTAQPEIQYRDDKVYQKLADLELSVKDVNRQMLLSKVSQQKNRNRVKKLENDIQTIRFYEECIKEKNDFIANSSIYQMVRANGTSSIKLSE